MKDQCVYNLIQFTTQNLFLIFVIVNQFYDRLSTLREHYKVLMRSERSQYQLPVYALVSIASWAAVWILYVQRARRISSLFPGFEFVKRHLASHCDFACRLMSQSYSNACFIYVLSTASTRMINIIHGYLCQQDFNSLLLLLHPRQPCSWRVITPLVIQ